MNNPVVKKAAAIIIGIAIFVGLVVGYFAIFGTRAADYEPRDVIVSNIEKNSVKATWATGVDTQGVVEYGTTPTALNFFAPEAVKTKIHTIDLTLLSPSTTYYFDIRVGDTKYDNGGVPWTFTTKGAEESVVSPTAAPTKATSQPTPVQSLKVSDGTNCAETDCGKIKLLLGKGCSTQDYFCA
ncbi:MAG: fibronectin type III domain-containing protein [Patescibacteria group bacterium]